MPFNVGENVGPYRIIEQLGQGGMATVFKAYHASLDRYVAIKALHPAFNRDPNFEGRFQREARVVAKLEHPNIVPVYDYAEHENRPYLVMKFVEGITLKARMDDGSLTPDEISRVVVSVGAALVYAHKQGVLHRDIKPSNVLLANDGQIYLADFGLARMAQSGESTLSSDMIMGTPQYISPEQAMGKPDLDQRTDLYSFGVMMYEMAVGKVPFNADTPFSIIHDHIYAPLPLPRSVNPKVTESVERVLLKSLSKEREDRYEDVDRLVKAFKDAWAEMSAPLQIPEVRSTQLVHQDVSTVAKVAQTKVAIPPAVATVNIEEKSVESVAVQGSEKKHSRWIWLSAVLMVVICAGLFVFARNNRLFARLLGGQQPLPQVSTPALAPLPNEPVNPLPGPELHGDLPPVVAEAEKVAHENPGDLDAQLGLALAYWDAAMPGQSLEMMRKLAEMAGPDNREFYARAGNQFTAREAWPPAAFMSFQAFRSYQKEGAVPEGVINQFHEAMYKAAERPEIAPLQLDVLSEVDHPISLVVKARSALYNGRVDDGRVFLEQARQLVADMPEVIMLQAEFDRHDGKSLEARNAARELASNVNVPEWIRIFAEEFLKRTP